MPISEQNVLVLQGGGALGAYQAGAFQKLSTGGFNPQWVAGISIGSINAAIICGNPPETRIEQLEALWEKISSSVAFSPWTCGPKSRQAFAEFAAATTNYVVWRAGFFQAAPSGGILAIRSSPGG